MTAKILGEKRDILSKQRKVHCNTMYAEQVDLMAVFG